MGRKEASDEKEWNKGPNTEGRSGLQNPSFSSEREDYHHHTTTQPKYCTLCSVHSSQSSRTVSSAGISWMERGDLLLVSTYFYSNWN